MSKKTYISLVGVFCLFLLASCAAEKLGNSEKTVNIFDDPDFSLGFIIYPTLHSEGAKEIGRLKFDPEPANPVWHLAQWSSRYDISLAKGEADEAKESYKYANEGKVVAKEYVDGEALLTLKVIGEMEYKDGTRKNGEAWPHLLIEQVMGDPQNVDSFSELMLNLDVRINDFEYLMTSDFDANLHAAQTTAYFGISNQNKESEGYSDFFWFGIPIFDSRFEYPPGGVIKDAGQPGASGALIYTPPGKEFLTKNMLDGEWETIHVDLIPYIQRAVEEGKQKGYLPKTSFEDLKITSFNLGWELPGTYNASLQIKNLELIGRIK
ncbi:hypothetical protein [Paenibacillus sp. IITD108]|uniref:hypothetical protein n=1 Tax=Paenibacillus sp. IITD108 TaxID=3116649 RepID=UPI002F3E2DC3